MKTPSSLSISPAPRKQQDRFLQVLLGLLGILVSSAIANPIAYTYTYDGDSLPPSDPGEFSNPTYLNDGVLGTTWDAATVLYHSSGALTKMPKVTLTLDPYTSLGKLRVRYASWTAAGIPRPFSLTVSDDFAHTATTIFPFQGDYSAFDQDVALTGMAGQVLHLNFNGTGEFVGLNEVQILTQDPMPPTEPLQPVPTDGNVNVSTSPTLQWNASIGADSYDIYFWAASQSQPATPTATVATNSWAASGISQTEDMYNWKVVAKNTHGENAGAVWTFTTSIFPFTYTYENSSARPENYGGGYGETQATPNLLADGQVGGLWGGGGLVLYFGNDYTDQPAAYWPAITMTLAQAPASYQFLRIWHYGGGIAGVHAPNVVTVSDDFGHSTTFSGFPDVPTFTDVPITEMQGTTLHLLFGPVIEFVGISEIKVAAVSGASPYDTWIAAKGVSGPAAEFNSDPDGDGIANGMEFVLGGEPNPVNPSANSNGLLPTGEIVGSDFVFTFTRRDEAAYLNPFVQFSTDLSGSWATAVHGVNASIQVIPDSPADTVIVTIPRGANDKMFTRVKVANSGP